MLLFYHFIGNTAIYFSMHNSGKAEYFVNILDGLYVV